MTTTVTGTGSQRPSRPVKKPIGRCVVTVTENNTRYAVRWQSPRGVSDGYIQYTRGTGEMGFKGAKRGTPYAAEMTGVHVGKVLGNKLLGVHLCLRGASRVKPAVVKGLLAGGLKILSIVDQVPDPHNGCRPKAARRV